MKHEEIMEIIERVTRDVVEKQVEAEVDILPDNVHISIKPWKPFEMKCPYKEG